MQANNNEPKLTPVSSLGEFGLIEHLTKDLKTNRSSTILGVGDDCAILEKDEKNYTLLTTDMLVEGVHFDLMYTPLKHLGYKAVVVNLSDIYAMNGQPQQITVSLALSSKYTVEAMDQLYEGIRLACTTYGVDLVGGDTTSSLKGMAISITAIGTVAKEKVVRRNTARANDYICVSGDLGAAYLGLQVLEREKKIFKENPEIAPELDKHQYIVGRLLKPEARKEVVQTLADNEVLPTSMIDISDGLSSEILHIARQSNLGCNLYEQDIPVHEEAEAQSLKFNLSPMTCALSGGEDYELLFTIRPEDFQKIGNLVGITVIGEMTDQVGSYKFHARGGEQFDLQAQGWNALLEREE